jgi:hypothetical protein
VHASVFFIFVHLQIIPSTVLPSVILDWRGYQPLCRKGENAASACATERRIKAQAWRKTMISAAWCEAGIARSCPLLLHGEPGW